MNFPAADESGADPRGGTWVQVDYPSHLGWVRLNQFPESSRNRASIPYGRSAGSCRNVTPLAFSSSYVFWQSAVSNTPPPSEPFATSARTGVPPIPGCVVLMWTRPHPDGEQSGRSTAYPRRATVSQEPQPKEHR